jgi:hypothetical protein
VVRIADGSVGGFVVNGEYGGGMNYNITLTDNVALDCQSPSCSGDPSMNVALEFLSGLIPISSGSSVRTLNGYGNDVIDIEGVLSVGANQSEGEYLGTYNITVDY